jgi:replication initiation and membrane attachment protein DnaB
MFDTTLPIVFSVQKQYDFNVNTNILSTFYAPIIGNDATRLYISLVNESAKQLIKVSKTTKYTEFNDLNNFSDETFSECRKNLEAVGLIETYYDQKSNKYVHILLSCKSPSEIFNDNQFIELLKSKISDVEYDTIQYMYNSKQFLTANLVNVSEDFSFLSQNKVFFKIDYKEIEQIISAKIKTFVSIDDTIKLIISKYEKQLNKEKIVELLMFSIDIDNGIATISKEKLNNSINIHFNITNSSTKTTIVKRNRNLFLNNSVLRDEKEEIYNSYKNTSTVDYVKAITKKEVSIEDYEFINSMLKLVSNDILNMAFDYCLTLKTYNGANFNKKYISKNIDTINSKGIKTLDDLLAHYNGSFANACKRTDQRRFIVSNNENTTTDSQTLVS